jgi:hypothetical protein
MQEENQSILFGLRNENNNLKLKIKNLTKQFENKCEELTQCERDATNLKAVHSQQLKENEVNLMELRDRLHQAEKSSELRIGNLESKINELCSIIANYESNLSNKNMNTLTKK